VADWLLSRRNTHGDLRVAVIAAGERWPDASLRPAIEDLWGAGALIAACAQGWRHVSPEARAAAAAFSAIASNLTDALSECASGQELIHLGFQDDVNTAAQLDHATCVPLLREGAFVGATAG
jgi:2-phosphosulfolactate phosphatase